MTGEIIQQVKEMREAQRMYRKTGDWQLRGVVLLLEARVDKLIRKYDSTRTESGEGK